jgi:cell division protein FtsQ
VAGPTTTARGASEPAGTPRAPGAPRGSSGPGTGCAPRRRLPLRPRVLLGALAAAALAGGLIWLLYGSAWLRVERVRAEGTAVLGPDRLIAAAEVPLGTPLVSVDTDAIEARLRERLPRIDRVEVSRSWPSGITLDVTERKPVLALVRAGGYTEVDAGGVRFATVDRAPAGVPRLELMTSGSVSLRRFGTERLIEGAVRVRLDLPDGVSADLRTVVVRSYDHYVLELTRGRTVVWGSPEEAELKGPALTALLKAAPRARNFDVSAPTAPAVSET